MRGTPSGYGPLGRVFNATVLLAVLALLVLATPARAAGTLRILALGDSLTAGFGLPPEESFTTKLEQALKARGHDVSVINGGVSGDTTAGGLARLDWSLADSPGLVIVELGANDGLRGIDPAATRANLDAILTRLKERGIPVLLAGMYAPRNLGRDFAERFDRIFPELAAKHDVALYPFFLDGVATDPKLNQPDGIHPNAAGVAVIVERIVPAVEPLVRAAQG
ncbi:arylesterase [Arenibaculum pallidiluteum]|uniref:arylesterase n=1 Tax=Arenibaculum pallidiluteum TaxID=2812559 RepID=UPI001F4377A2|nr:arylesterase [Arenibaculum pallidiluteum]